MAEKRKFERVYPEYDPYKPSLVEYVIQDDGVSVFDRFGNHIGDYVSEADARADMLKSYFKQFSEV